MQRHSHSRSALMWHAHPTLCMLSCYSLALGMGKPLLLPCDNLIHPPTNPPVVAPIPAGCTNHVGGRGSHASFAEGATTSLTLDQHGTKLSTSAVRVVTGVKCAWALETNHNHSSSAQRRRTTAVVRAVAKPASRRSPTRTSQMSLNTSNCYQQQWQPLWGIRRHHNWALPRVHHKPQSQSGRWCPGQHLATADLHGHLSQNHG